MMKTKTRPTRKREIQGRINAIKGARLVLTGGKSVEEAAGAVDSNRHSVSCGLMILEFGTAEEIAAVERGELNLDATSRAIRKRTPEKDRLAKRRAPTQTAALVQARSIDAEIWGKLREALDAITSLPSPKDTAAIVRKNSMRIEHVNRKLLASLAWITEFSDEVTR